MHEILLRERDVGRGKEDRKEWLSQCPAESWNDLWSRGGGGLRFNDGAKN